MITCWLPLLASFTTTRRPDTQKNALKKKQKKQKTVYIGRSVQDTIQPRQEEEEAEDFFPCNCSIPFMMGAECDRQEIGSLQ